MRKIVWTTAMLMFVFWAVGVTADDTPVKIQKSKVAPLKPISNKLTLPSATPNSQPTPQATPQATPQPTPQATVTITIVGADIRSNGYTVEIRNESSVAAGLLDVTTFKGSGDKPYLSPAGSVSVQGLNPGATTQITIDQPSGWNTGYSVFTVEVREQVGAHGVIVGRRAFSIPPL